MRSGTSESITKSPVSGKDIWTGPADAENVLRPGGPGGHGSSLPADHCPMDARNLGAQPAQGGGRGPGGKEFQRKSF